MMSNYNLFLGLLSKLAGSTLPAPAPAMRIPNRAERRRVAKGGS